MTEHKFTELGKFREEELQAIKEELQGRTFMKFNIMWEKRDEYCTLIVGSDYDDTEEHIKNFFLTCALADIFTLKYERI